MSNKINRLGFYYHVPVKEKNGKLFTPGYFGVFLESLANEVNSLIVFLHDANPHEEKELDYEIQSTNIIWVNLGYRKPAWHRSFLHKNNLLPFKNKLTNCDLLLVRAPSPLAPYFHHYVSRDKIKFMIVGDYKEGAKNYKLNTLRNIFITLYLYINDFVFSKEIMKTQIVVNSEGLYERYKNKTKQIDRITTTTLSQKDFYEREDTCLNSTIDILYTGRIDIAKGLIELIDATTILNLKGYDIRLNIVGWEIKEGAQIENSLKAHALKQNISHKVIFHGKKRVGKELNELYRKSDIYAIPSHHEGFPRTIWEAMANSLPVVATPVGGIPHQLTDKINVLFTEVKNSKLLSENIEEIIQNKELRKNIIHNGYLLAKEKTLEKQTSNLVKIIEKQITKKL